MGGSNGGLLVGAALTQQPGRYRAVVCSAPLLDMVRYEEFSLGRTWNDEYGTAADPEELGWLLSYSPYHHVVPGTEYPAVLFTVFESDTRVDPLHARKMCAALQHATSGDPAHPADPDPPGDRRRARRPVDLPDGRAGRRPAGVPGRAHRAGADAVNPTELLPTRPACADDAGVLVRPVLRADQQRRDLPVGGRHRRPARCRSR